MLYAIVAVIALIFDQLIKYWTTVNVVENTGEVKLIPGFVHLANVHNTGAAFSFLRGGRWFFVVLCAIFVAVVIYLMLKETIRSPGARWSAVIVMAGAVGNAIDRVIAGFVVDMFEFDFTIFGRRFPVFNLADIYITLGVIVFCIFMLTEKPQTAAVGAAPEKKKRASVLPKKQKTEIPTFPKREPRPAPPPMDPSDPFAEWERLAKKKETPPAEEAPAPKRQSVTYTQPAAAEEVQMRLFPDEPEQPQPAAPVTPAAPVAAQPAPAAPEETEHLSNTERVMRMLVNGTASVPQQQPAAPAPAPAPTPAPAPASSAEPEYNLDDILAEFKDL